MPDWLTQIQEFIRYHMPSGDAAMPLWPAAVSIVVGLVFCLAGARLVRSVIVLGFAGAGAAVGAQVAGQLNVSIITAILLGVVLAGLVGYAFFRLWVALLAGTVAVLIAAGVAIGPTVPGIWQEFEDARIAGGATGEGFALMSPAQQVASQQMHPAEYGRAFVGHVWAKYPGDSRRLVVILGAAFLVGAAFGLLAYRWAIVIGTAAVGTALILGGAIPLVSRYWPQGIDLCRQRPNEALIVLGVWGLIAILAQRRGLRPAPLPAASAPAQR